MVSDPSSVADEANVIAEKKPDDGLNPDKKGQVRVPKKTHKAEREKLKRDQLNELFLELEPDRQNSCKASILGGTTRMLRDLFAQVESLRKENAALLSESCYITLERNELKDENSTLQAEISELQNEIEGRTHSDPAWSNNPVTNSPSQPQQRVTLLPVQHHPIIMEPVHAPAIRELQLFPESRTPTPPTSPRPSSNVRRPHARYHAQSDSWPCQLLSSLPRTAQEEPCSSSSITTTNNKEEISDRI